MAKSNFVKFWTRVNRSMTVDIIFNDSGHTLTTYVNVTEHEVHTYNFLELVFADGTSESFNLERIFSFKVH